jgi:hypothetical protein
MDKNKVILNSEMADINLEGYTKISIPWEDGTNNNIYAYIKPDTSSQVVYLGSDANLNEQSRTKTLVFRTTAPGLTIGEQSQAILGVTQLEASYSYEVYILTINPSEFTEFNASGGTVEIGTYVDIFINGKYSSSRKVDNPVYEPVSSGSDWVSFLPSEVKGNTIVQAANTGTTVTLERSVTIRATTTYGSADITFKQQANVQSLSSLKIETTLFPLGGAISNMPADGDTTIIAVAYASYSYTSGEVTSLAPIKDTNVYPITWDAISSDGGFYKIADLSENSASFKWHENLGNNSRNGSIEIHYREEVYSVVTTQLAYLNVRVGLYNNKRAYYNGGIIASFLIE